MTTSTAQRIVKKAFPSAVIDAGEYVVEGQSKPIYAVFAKVHPTSVFSIAIGSYKPDIDAAWIAAAQKIVDEKEKLKARLKELGG